MLRSDDLNYPCNVKHGLFGRSRVLESEISPSGRKLYFLLLPVGDATVLSPLSITLLDNILPPDNEADATYILIVDTNAECPGRVL